MSETSGPANPVPPFTAPAIVAWIVVSALIGVALTFFVGMAVDAGYYGFAECLPWVLGGFILMGAFGLLVLTKVPRQSLLTFLLPWAVAAIVAIVALAVTWANTSVIHHGIPPGPGETMDSTLGWFTGRFWGYFIPSKLWILASLIPYALCVVVGYFVSHRKP